MHLPISVSRNRVLQCLVACGLLGFCGVLAATEDATPDAAFLEYLGSWEESDEDWLLVRNRDNLREVLEQDEPEQDEPEQDERTDPAPQGDESTEAEHENK